MFVDKCRRGLIWGGPLLCYDPLLHPIRYTSVPRFTVGFPGLWCVGGPVG